MTYTVALATREAEGGELLEAGRSKKKEMEIVQCVFCIFQVYIYSTFNNIVPEWAFTDCQRLKEVDYIP